MTESTAAPSRRFALTVEIELKPGQRDAFLALMKGNSGGAATEPGCRAFDVLVGASGEGPDRVFLYEIYDDEAAFKAHLATAHYLTFDKMSAPLVATKAVKFYDLVQGRAV